MTWAEAWVVSCRTSAVRASVWLRMESWAVMPIRGLRCSIEAIGDAVEVVLVFQEAAGSVVSQSEPAAGGGQDAAPFIWVLFAAGR